MPWRAYNISKGSRYQHIERMAKPEVFEYAQRSWRGSSVDDSSSPFRIYGPLPVQRSSLYPSSDEFQPDKQNAFTLDEGLFAGICAFCEVHVSSVP